MADDAWYYAQNNQQLGPVTLEALRGMAASGQLAPDNLVWTQGMPQWLPARTVPEVSGSFASAPAAAPAPMHMPTGYPPQPQPMMYGTPGPYAGGQDFSGKATTALVLGIASLPLCLCPLVGIGLGVAAIVVAKGVPEGDINRGRAKAGLICGIIGLAFGVINAIAGVAINLSNLKH
jgi:hypothetical protein